MSNNYCSSLYQLLKKIEKFGKSFQKLTIETVKTFFKDTKNPNLKFRIGCGGRI